jgi:hypothetical protein
MIVPDMVPSANGAGQQQSGPTSAAICEHCSAPICPNLKSSPDAIWFADESFCRKHEFSSLEYVRTQRKIARRVLDRERPFDLDFLSRVRRITPKTQGNVDPDRNLTEPEPAKEAAA